LARRMIELAARERLLEELRDVLSKNPGKEQILVSRRTLYHALTSFLDGKVDRVELVEWANLVEQHDDEIVYETRFPQFIATFVFRLSTPEINGSIDREVCRQMLAELVRDGSKGS
jgi:hypothetical protein